jgi:hypothetical protein
MDKAPPKKIQCVEPFFLQKPGPGQRAGPASSWRSGPAGRHGGVRPRGASRLPAAALQAAQSSCELPDRLNWRYSATRTTFFIELSAGVLTMPSMQSHLRPSGSVRGEQGTICAAIACWGEGSKRGTGMYSILAASGSGRCWLSTSPTQEQPPANNQAQIARNAKTAPIDSSRRVSPPPSFCFPRAAAALGGGVALCVNWCV